MTRTTQTTIRNLIKAGAAKELVNTTSVKPGELYAIAGRSATLFYYC